MTDADIFTRAAQMSGEQRQGFLLEACGDDPARLQRLLRLLSADGHQDALLDQVDLLESEANAARGWPRQGVPSEIGDFTVGRLLGRGGMGVVYEARQKSLKRAVALKLLSSGLGLSSRAILRFRREAEAAGKLHHTNIVPIYTTGEENGVHFYAMELIDGPSLDQVIKERQRSESTCDESLAETSSRFSEAHARTPASEPGNSGTAIERNSAADHQQTILPQSTWLAVVDEGKLQYGDPESAASPIDDTRTTSDEVARSNRQLIEAAFPQVIHTEDIHRPYYHLQRAGYALMYSLTTWSLIFGCIGFSQYYFDRQSSFWRYFSDASYWFYLAHLPIQFAILILVGESPWHWTVKFAVYVLGNLAILLPSYHFLIRPSWIGWMLNGRMESVWQRDRKRQTGKVIRMTVSPVASAPDFTQPSGDTPMAKNESMPLCLQTREHHE